MTDDVAATVAALQAEGIEVARPISDQGWGLLTAMTLPGGVELGLYQPQHPTAAQPAKVDPVQSNRSGVDGGSRQCKTFISQGCVLVRARLG